MNQPPDWQIPPGVSRDLWDYLHDSALARTVDERLAGTPLLAFDLAFAENWLDRPGRLIDLGCSSGLARLSAAARGFSAVGFDLSGEMLSVAAAKERAAGVTVRLAKMNLVELDALADAQFDAALCLFS